MNTKVIFLVNYNSIENNEYCCKHITYDHFSRMVNSWFKGRKAVYIAAHIGESFWTMAESSRYDKSFARLAEDWRTDRAYLDHISWASRRGRLRLVPEDLLELFHLLIWCLTVGTTKIYWSAGRNVAVCRRKVDICHGRCTCHALNLPCLYTCKWRYKCEGASSTVQ